MEKGTSTVSGGCGHVQVHAKRYGIRLTHRIDRAKTEQGWPSFEASTSLAKSSTRALDHHVHMPASVLLVDDEAFCAGSVLRRGASWVA